jgi:hypothetical protein
MATPSPAQTSATDPYDLGDTGISFKPAASTPTPKPDQPRNPDGTFAKPAEASAAPAAPAAPEPKPQHSPELIELAHDWGFTDAELADMTPAAVRASIKTMKRNREALRAQGASSAQLEAVIRQAQERFRVEQPDKPAAPAPEELGIDWGKDKDGRALSEADFGGEITHVIKGLVRRIKDLEGKLEGKIGELAQRQEASAAMTSAEKLDAAFAALPAKYHVLFGTKAADEMTDDEKAGEMQRRLLVLKAANVNVKQVPARVGALIQKAADTIFGPLLKEEPAPTPQPSTSPAPKTPTPEEWASAGLAAPTQRSGASEPKGKELAIARMTERLGGDAVATAAGDTEILDGLVA